MIGTGYYTTKFNAFYSGGGAAYLVDDYSPQIAYSTRKISSTATNCLRVRRSSDSAEQDIGFSGNDIDNSAITSFVGANDGFVVKWYNQGTGGTSYDSSQTTAANQPKIVESGTIVTQGGQTAIKLVSAYNNVFVDTAVDYTSGQTIFGVQTIDGASSSSTFLMPYTTGTSSVYLSAASNGAITNCQAGWSGTIKYYADGTEIPIVPPAATVIRDQIYDNLCDNVRHLHTVEGQTYAGTLQMRMQYYNVALYAAGNVQEILIFNTDEAANRTAIETDINSHYSIY